MSRYGSIPDANPNHNEGIERKAIPVVHKPALSHVEGRDCSLYVHLRQEGVLLTASEMQALLSNGLTIGIMDINGGTQFRGSVTINADGTQSGSLQPTGQSPIALSGSWKLKGAKFCRVLRPISDKEVCETWVKTGDKQITVMIGAKPAGLNILP